ncbi:MAG: amidohydrolase family protein [Acidobacteriota bacterium]|nr:amidohydrolase family protein [Acidobacteriota bacterium]
MKKPSNSNRKALVLVFSLLIFGRCSRLGTESSVSSADLVIRNGFLLDMVSDQPQLKPIKGLVISGEKIQKIVPADSSESLPEAPLVIEAGSSYILPGLIDAHVHFRSWFPEIFLHYGVTSLMDTGPCGPDCEEDPNEWILRHQRALDDGSRKGPTLYITGMKLDGPDGKTDNHIYRLQSLDEISTKIDFLARLGVDAIKAEEDLPVDFRKRIIEEASKRGLPVVGHSRDAIESINVGMRFIEHTYPIARALATDPELAYQLGRSSEHLIDMNRVPEMIDLMLENQVYLNPTLMGRFRFFSERRFQYSREDKELLSQELFQAIPEEYRSRLPDSHLRAETMPPEERRMHEKAYENVKVLLKQFSSKGGLLLAASDALETSMPGLWTHREVQLLVDAGVTPYAALLGATRYPAELMRKQDLIGTVQVGKQADLLIVTANPLQDIAATQDIEYVIKKGIIERRPQ